MRIWASRAVQLSERVIALFLRIAGLHEHVEVVNPEVQTLLHWRRNDPSAIPVDRVDILVLTSNQYDWLRSLDLRLFVRWRRQERMKIERRPILPCACSN